MSCCSFGDEEYPRLQGSEPDNQRFESRMSRIPLRRKHSYGAVLHNVIDIDI